MNELKKIDKIIELVSKRLVEVYSPDRIYLFGSYAWGKPDSDSDLDILVILGETDEKKMHKRILKGRRVLADLEIPKDIVVYTNIEFEQLASQKSSLCYKIKNEGVTLYETAWNMVV